MKQSKTKLNSLVDLDAYGIELLAEIQLKPSDKAVVIALSGDLGTGKTTLVQTIARDLGITEIVTSPTFVIMKRFKIRKNSCPNSCKFASFYHIDCYRIQKSKEILNLGFKEIISNPKNIVAIEWADRIKKIIPQKSIILKFKFINQTTREIKLSFPQGLGDHFHQSSLYNRFS